MLFRPEPTQVSGEVVMTRQVAGLTNHEVVVELYCAILIAKSKDRLETFQSCRHIFILTHVAVKVGVGQLHSTIVAFIIN
jgi:hypothetical protein